MVTKLTVYHLEEKLPARRAYFAYNGWDWDPEEREIISDEVRFWSVPAIKGTNERC